MTRVAGELDQLRIALGEVGVLATLTAAAYDSADWMEPDPAVVDSRLNSKALTLLIFSVITFYCLIRLFQL